MASDESNTITAKITCSETFESWSENCISPQPDPQALSKDSKSYFEVTFQKSGDDNEISKALALLIVQLKVPLSSDSCQSKVSALSYLSGAMDGILSLLDTATRQTNSDIDTDNEVMALGDHDGDTAKVGKTAHRGLSLEMMKTISTFLLEHCAPLQRTPQMSIQKIQLSYPIQAGVEPEADENILQEVRDGAMACMHILLKLPCGRYSTEGNENDLTPNLLDHSIQFRLDVAQNAVQNRCASSDDDDDDDMIFDDHNYKQPGLLFSKALSGLSLLPRSRRSICFRVLEGAVIGASTDRIYSDTFHGQTTISDISKDAIESFAHFSSVCLHGETDPRCLVQMLLLLRLILLKLLPFFHVHNDLDTNFRSFPFIEIFDAVAPYYPVRFTPPPNDPYGITKEGIHKALMGVLKCHTTLKRNSVNHEKSDDFSSQSMTVLAIKLFLERLSPPSMDPFGDDNLDDADIKTVHDRIDALEDLTELLSLSSTDQTLPLSEIPHAVMSELSYVLIQCHDDSSAAAGINSGEDNEVNKTLANKCRKFASTMAYKLETQEKAFWDIFVIDATKKLQEKISSSPQSLKGRTATAYVASLLGCGGPQSLFQCLNICINPLLNILANDIDSNNKEEDKMIAAAYGIGAFFSACKISMDIILNRNVVLHPHPLQSYGSLALQTFCHILDNRETGKNLRVATLKAFEVILQCTPSGVLTEENVISTKSTLLSITNGSIDVNASTDEAMSDEFARIVGSIIGLIMKDDSEATAFFQYNSEVVSFVEEKLMPRILTSTLASVSNSNPERYDWIILSHACKTGKQFVSKLIVSRLVFELEETLLQPLSNDIKINARNIAMALSHILQEGGAETRTAFHSLIYPQKTYIDILEALASSTKVDASSSENEIGSLAFSETQLHQKFQTKMAIQFVYSILTHILPFFHGDVPLEKQKQIISLAERLLPPVSDYDCVKLCVVLPVLAKAIDVVKVEEHESLAESLVKLAPYLVEFAMNRDQDDSARVAAAQVSFLIGAKFQTNNETCLCLHLLRSIICPKIVRCASDILTLNMSESFADFEDAMKLCALMGSASACRGKVSSKTAAAVANMLVVVSSEGVAAAPSLGIVSPLDLRPKYNSTNEVNILSMIAASALGSMFSIDSSSTLWRQRLAHIVLPHVLTPKNRKISTEMLESEFGDLLCACHVISCVTIKAISKKEVCDVASLLVRGLEKCCTYSERKKGTVIHTNRLTLVKLSNLRILLLSSFICLLQSAPDWIASYIATIMPSLLLFLNPGDDLEDVRVMILALQALMCLATHRATQQPVKSYKTDIILYLTHCQHHPCVQVRQAAVKVRNFCFVTE